MQLAKKIQHTGSVSLFMRCAGYFAPYRLHIILAVFAMLLVAACQSAIAWLVQPVLDDIFINKKREALILIPAGFLCLTLIKVSARVVQNYIMQYCGLKVLEELRDALYRKIVYLPMKFYEGAQVGMLMSRIINDVVLIRSSVPALIMIIRQIVTIGGLIGVACYRDAYLTFLAVVVLPLAFYPLIYFSRRIRQLCRQSQAKLADISVLLQEMLSGIRVVKAFATEEKEEHRFDRENIRLLRLSLKQHLAGYLSSSVMELVGAVGIGLVLWYGGMEVIEGRATPGAFMSFVASLAMLYEPVKKISGSNNDMQQALAGAERVFEILDSPTIQVEESGSRELSEPFRELCYERVTFAYDQENCVLRDVNLTVKAGERIALVGPSGSGKTTFVNLIPRFYDPTEGRITLNGVPLTEYSLASLRRRVAVVSQDSFLFNLSVRDNILYGQDEVSDKDMEEAARAAYAHEFVEELPEAYDTLLGERGVRLSGGQKQRLTIARALVKDAPLLILDEATSALDSESESIVQRALENLMVNRTSIVIAHRLSTILNADRILVMEKGRILAEGRHEELLLRSPLYVRLYEMQFGRQA